MQNKKEHEMIDLKGIHSLKSGLGARIKNLRLKKNLSIPSVLENIPTLNRTYLRSIEQGESIPNLVELYSLASLFGVAIGELFPKEIPS